MFTKSFDSYVCSGESITGEVDGFKLTATIERDDDMGAPWGEHDGHGPVSDWTDRNKRPGEVILSNGFHSYRYYDMQAAIKQASKEGWGSVVKGTKDTYDLPGETPGQKAVRAAQRDFEVLKAWCDDEWFWCSITVTVERDGIELGHASLCGIEANYPDSDNAYLTEAANDLIDEAMDVAKKRMAKLVAEWRTVET